MAGSTKNPSTTTDVSSNRQLFHASGVAVNGRGLLITGPSGSGKSGITLELMAFGAGLISDDSIWVTTHPEGGLRLDAPEQTKGLIESRGMGLLMAKSQSSTWLSLVADLGQVESERLPPERTITILGAEVPVVHKVESPHFAPALLQYLRGGRVA